MSLSLTCHSNFSKKNNPRFFQLSCAVSDIRHLLLLHLWFISPVLLHTTSLTHLSCPTPHYLSDPYLLSYSSLHPWPTSPALLLTTSLTHLSWTTPHYIPDPAFVSYSCPTPRYFSDPSLLSYSLLCPWPSSPVLLHTTSLSLTHLSCPAPHYFSDPSLLFNAKSLIYLSCPTPPYVYVRSLLTYSTLNFHPSLLS